MLGIRFWDPVYGHLINNDLKVIAWPEKYPSLICKAIRTATGLYTFQGLAGLRSYEFANYTLLESPIAQRKFLVQIMDLQHRFLPVVIGILLPRPGNGVYPNGIDPPNNQGDPWPGVPLFTTPMRTAPPGIAVIRSQLIDYVSQKPAAYALARINLNGKNWYGIADNRGSLAVHLPYPKMNTITVGTTTSTITAPFSDQVWDFKLKVFFNPNKPTYKPDGVKHLKESALPDLKDIMEQPAVKLVHTQGVDAVNEHTYQLSYGKELVMKTNGKSELYIDTE